MDAPSDLAHVLQKLGVKVKFARDVIRDVCGYTPYERRAMELLAQGFDKRALKFCKKRVSAIELHNSNFVACRHPRMVVYAWPPNRYVPALIILQVC